MNEIIIVAGLGILTLLAEIFNFKKLLMPVIIAGLGATLLISILELQGSISNSAMDANVLSMLDFDRFAKCFVILLTVIALFWVLINYNYFLDESSRADHLALILFAMVGGYCMVSYSNFVILFLGIEILSIPMYVLAGSKKNSLRSNEAALKYFLMGSFATGVFLFGITLIYGTMGSFYVYDVRAKTTATEFALTPMFTVGVFMLISALSFKVSSAPFHFWAPDVYSGAPTSVTSFMATFVKTSAIAAFIRLFYTALPFVPDNFSRIFVVLIVS
ncbi:MAG: proton-conducting transporter membrane subunit, partial [Bacteroidetes bacterium]|nr:proton-conducting transporter membrane subunit [Bacteroidota bacterium]